MDWQHQKEAAFRAVRYLTGVKGVTNRVTVKARAKALDVRTQIEDAFRRSAEIDERRINVIASDGTVILSGNVHALVGGAPPGGACGLGRARRDPG